MKNAVLTLGALISLILFSCNQTKPVEQTEGNMTDRFSVDKEGRKHGEFRRFFGKDTLAELSNYEHGLLDGVRTIYNKYGKPEIIETYVKDTLDGPYKVLFEDGGVKIEGEYDNGIMRGIWKRYYNGGQLLEEVTFEDNLENGPFVEFHENGKMRAKGSYLDGDFEHDSLFLFDESGLLERKMLCDRGVCRTVWLAPDLQIDTTQQQQEPIND